MDCSTVGNLIKSARVKKGYTQKEIAIRLGVTDKAVSKWECGKSFPDITMIESISRELGISINQLVGVADDSKEEAVVLKQNEKKIRIRLTIALVVFATVCLRGLVKLTCNLSTYWFVSDILESVFYIVFIAIGVFCLISSIVLYKSRKENEK